MGGQTSQGIKLIEVKGNSDAEFIAGDRIIAGAYTYELQRGDSLGNNMKDWFLTSRLSQEPLAYYANYLAANDVLDLRLQDRTGSKEFTEYLKDGEEEKAESLWARSVYYKNPIGMTINSTKPAPTAIISKWVMTLPSGKS